MLRYFVLDAPEQPDLDQAVTRIFDTGEDLHFTPQVARESWAVLTRPRHVGGYSQTPEQAAKFLESAAKAFTFLPDVANIYVHWLDLVTTHGVSGRQGYLGTHLA